MMLQPIKTGVIGRTKSGLLCLRKDGSMYVQKEPRKLRKKDRQFLKELYKWERTLR